MARVQFSQFGVSRGSLEWVQIRENPGEEALSRGRIIYQEQAVFYRCQAKTLRQNGRI
jgi:hypothetical protein